MKKILVVNALLVLPFLVFVAPVANAGPNHHECWARSQFGEFERQAIRDTRQDAPHLNVQGIKLPMCNPPAPLPIVKSVKPKKNTIDQYKPVPSRKIMPGDIAHAGDICVGGLIRKAGPIDWIVISGQYPEGTSICVYKRHANEGGGSNGGSTGSNGGSTGSNGGSTGSNGGSSTGSNSNGGRTGRSS